MLMEKSRFSFWSYVVAVESSAAGRTFKRVDFDHAGKESAPELNCPKIAATRRALAFTAPPTLGVHSRIGVRDAEGWDATRRSA